MDKGLKTQIVPSCGKHCRLGTTFLQGPWWIIVLRGLLVWEGGERQIQFSLALTLPLLAFMVVFPIQNTQLRHEQD